jgi:DNA-binding transcriptional ArsR family regulator
VTDVAQVLDALGAPTRREVLDLLYRGERTVRELTEAVDVTQPAVSQHLKVLAGASLVRSRTSGTRRLYRIDPDGFASLRAWVDRFWDEALTEFTAYIDRHPTPSAAADEEQTP